MSDTSRPKWSLKTLIEVLPVIIALTAIFSYSTIRNVTTVDLVTPLGQVLSGVPGWVVGLMGLILVLGLCGMGWLIYIFRRALVASDSHDEPCSIRSETTPSHRLTAVLLAVVVVAMAVIALLTVTAILSGPPAG